MLKGFILLNDPSYPSRVRINPSHLVSYVTQRSGALTRLVMASKDADENDTYHVHETPDEIDALIEAAQGETPKSEFAQAMGGAMVGAFGGAR